MKVFSCLLLLLVAGNALCQDANIYFNSNSDVLRMNDVTKLQEVISQYKQKKFTLLLKGYADTVGQSSYNMNLSRRRAESIRAFLSAHGVDKKDIAYEFHGEAESGRQDQSHDRRVELYISGAHDFSSTSKLVRALQPPAQLFVISTNSESVIEGRKGTIVTVPAHSFHYRDGRPVEGAIKIDLKEYYSFTDFIAGRLNTVSDGQLLVSGGMVNIRACSDTSEVFLNDGQKVQLSFPKKDEGDFETFLGERGPDGNINWKPQKEIKPSNAGLDPNNIGIYITNDGHLEVTDRKTADELMSRISYDTVTHSFVQLSDGQLKEYEKNTKEQHIYDSARKDYYHTIYTSTFNFINCDHPLNERTAPIEYYVKISNPDVRPDIVFLIFHNLNSVVGFSANDDRYELKMNLPAARFCSLLVVGINKNGRPCIYYQPVKLAGTRTDVIELKEQTSTEVEAIFKKINGS